ncbi:PPOX class F420-dependent oxidoreductase [Microlunatus sp. Gsoil 973]|jgi:pyridoxamine 5'-phosphate oxidase family protein|uniref:PPOX class F420-dependent oxidoreductase n=1 Tax=Microlunatus sp. Gsoil 973 TaxID=2672569 RepID=UPI0012B4B7D1|nr:PPOX class F420-dependent oxidoreductase [Microlunatus sp. Gsoil 973]QGN34075.1 PPOX class F420-dependent oxidoreductase [Microlunatus sp. Gsoil 973]
MSFTESELGYLATQVLARLATVAPDGTVQNSPVGFFVNTDLGTIDIGGHNLARTKKFRNIATCPQVAVVIDDLASRSPWTVRGVEVRGTAEALADVDPPRPGFSRQLIRITPRRIISWGIDPEHPGHTARTV